MIIARGIVAAAVLICWPLAARAYECTDEQREKSNAIFEEAKKAYRLAHFDEAIVLFSTGYEACADPMFLLNLGIAHKKLEQWEKAIHFYRSYLLEDPEAQDRERLGASIKEMERKLAEEKARAMPTPAGDPGPQPEPVAGEELPVPWWRDGWGWGLVGGGAVVLGLGTAFHFHAGSLRDDAADTVDQGEAARLESSASNYETTRTVFLIAGGGAVAVGIVKLVLHETNPASDRMEIACGLGWCGVSGRF